MSRESNGTPLQYSCLENPMDGGAWWAAVYGVSNSRTRLNDFTFTFYLHALEKEMETHSSVFAWRIPGTGEPGGLPSMGSHRVGHDWSDLAPAAAAWMRCLCVLHLFSFNCHSCSSGLEKSRSWLWLYLLIWFSPRLHTFRFQSVLRLPVFNLATFSSPAISSAISLLWHSLWKPPATSGLTFLHVCSNYLDTVVFENTF